MANTRVPIDDTEMQSLRRALKVAHKYEPWPFREVSQEVESRHGFLNSIKAKVIRFDDKQRLILSIALLKQSAFVDLEGHNIIPIGSPEGKCISTDTVGLIPRLRSTDASFQECAFS